MEVECNERERQKGGESEGEEEQKGGGVEVGADKEADSHIEIEKNAENVIVVPMENSTEK